MTAKVKDIRDARKKREPIAGEWAKGLITKDDGTPKKCMPNVLHVLGEHPDWQGVIAYDLFSQRITKLRPPPVRRQDEPEAIGAGDWTEADSVRTAAWLASTIGLDAAVSWVDAAVSVVAERNLIHPVRDWLRSLEWDGTKRLDGMLATYFGAKDSRYTRAAGSKWMISAVARVEQPGCKADHMLVLESEAQGIGKSTALRILASDPWFSDTGIIVGDKDSYQALGGVWIFEMAELSSIRGREVERVKGFLSSPSDRYRPSYGRITRDFPRQTVFAGSTNEDHYLTDPTGARRFWPVRCQRIDLEGLRRDREQLWAEAKRRYDGGERWHLDHADVIGEAAAEQGARSERDDWIDIVETWLKAPTRPDGNGGRDLLEIDKGITTADVLLGGLGFTADRIASAATKRAGHVLRAIGFEPRLVREKDGSRPRRYFRTCAGTCTTSAAGSGSVTGGSGGSGDLYTHTHQVADGGITRPNSEATDPRVPPDPGRAGEGGE